MPGVFVVPGVAGTTLVEEPRPDELEFVELFGKTATTFAWRIEGYKG